MNQKFDKDLFVCKDDVQKQRVDTLFYHEFHFNNCSIGDGWDAVNTLGHYAIPAYLSTISNEMNLKYIKKRMDALLQEKQECAYKYFAELNLVMWILMWYNYSANIASRYEVYKFFTKAIASFAKEHFREDEIKFIEDVRRTSGLHYAISFSDKDDPRNLLIDKNNINEDTLEWNTEGFFPFKKDNIVRFLRYYHVQHDGNINRFAVHKKELDRVIKDMEYRRKVWKVFHDRDCDLDLDDLILAFYYARCKSEHDCDWVLFKWED